MKTINKSAKSILSLVLAFAMLAGSLFVANIGININAGAETAEGVEKVWDGKIADKFSDTESKGTKDDPIEISEPGELAFLANGAGSNATDGNLTHGKYYKIADGIKAFNMAGMEGITINSSIDAVDTATPTTNTWDSVYSYTYLNGIDNDGDGSADYTSFDGYFDGNGIIVYNIYGTNTSMGLFPAIDGGAVIENITVKNSVFNSTTSSSHAVGGIFGFHSHGSDTAYIRNCTVENVSLNAKSSSLAGVGTIAGSCRFRYIEIQDCLALNNKITTISGSSTTTGIVGRSENSNYKVINTVSIGDTPVVPASNIGKFSNVYTTNGSTTTGVTLFGLDDLKGTAAQTNMPALDWSGTWFANTTTYPVLRAFHNLTATNNGDGTHSEVCSDCGLEGVPANHYYNTVDKVNNITLCSCGAYIDGIFDVWDSEGATADSYAGGTGTEDDPYIIETVEQLFKMVSEAGEDEEGNPQYYKVADGVSALYINDTRGYASQAAFEAAAAADTLYNWSEKIPTGFCDSCSHTKPATVTLFNGYFDGNGATIYGLYSKTTSTNSWVNGTGFVPGMVRNSTIKNVIFDTSYVKSSAESAAVVCSSFGLSSASSHVAAGYCCDDFEEMLIYKATPSLINIAVRNAYVESKSSMPDDIDGDGKADDNYYSYSAGITANYSGPKSLNIQNCLFDGTNSTLVSDTGSGTTADTLITSGGIFAAAANWVYTTAEYCVSIGADVSNKAENISAQNSYTTDANATSGAFITADYATVNGMPLLNWTAWDIDAVATYGTPMPKLVSGWEVKDYRYYKNAFKNSEYYDNPVGATPINSGYESGVFSDFNELSGSGTEADPYIIDNEELLFEIIASGGTNRGVGQYFKLACDMDLGGIQWVNYRDDATDINDGSNDNGSWHIEYYNYHPFAGTIDGDGHTVTGMFTATSDTNAGFIPELAATGVVKNLHFRNAYAYTNADDGNYGIIAGTAASGSQIIGCSIESSENAVFAGSNAAKITNSYITVDGATTYYLESDATGTPTVDGKTWYQGGADGSTPKLVNRADAMPYADADGDGDGYEYTANDLSSLKQKLTRKSAYNYVYGDVSRNGKTDIRDLVIMQREVAEDGVEILDGFWKNVKAGKISIYYDETDNYDFARKMELYLEETTGTDIAKTLGTTTANLTIRIVTDSTLGANNYSVSYDLETGVLTVSGGSFTAVEQGVLAFINGSNAVTGVVYTGTGSLSDVTNSAGEAYKTAVTVDGQPYYYVWGDEFDSGDTVNIDGTDYTTVSYDKWLLRNKGVDTTLDNDDESDDHKTTFAYISAATDAQAPLINTVSDGKLTLKRGINSQTDMYASGVSTKTSMLYKQGYAEMLVTLPSDGYAFPAWWLLTHPDAYSNVQVSRSLYGKVYELNDNFDGTTNYFTPTNYKSYQYKLPTQTLEVDIFEIIQQPVVKYNALAIASTDYDVSFNIHKWYSFSTAKDDTSLTVYDLDWDNVVANGGFNTKLLTATGSNGENYSIDSQSIKVNTTNLADGQVNGAVTYEGGKSNTSTTPSGVVGESMNANMASYRSNGQVRKLKYAFLWTENDMTFYIYDGETLVYSTTVNKSMMNYKSGESYNAGNYGFDQYAYMLIENHWYTAISQNNGWYYVNNNISACDMVIDYVRLYQLDGHRDIVTPETENFNSDTRW